MPSPDALPVAVQPAGEAATAEMVHSNNGAGEEEGDPGHDDVSAEPSTTFLQLPPMERPEDRLQEVATNDTAAFFICVIVTRYFFCVLSSFSGRYRPVCWAETTFDFLCLMLNLCVL